MPEQNNNAFNVYELMENDNGEVMVLIYANSTAPQNPTFLINTQKKCIEISRNKDDTIFIDGLQNESITKLKTLDTLYVCEIKYTDNEDDTEIVYAYAAKCGKPKQETPSAKHKLIERAENLNEKIKKNQNQNKATQSKK